MKSIVIAALLLGNVLAGAFSQTNGSWTVNNTAAWITAVNGIRSGSTNKEYTIRITSTISIPPSTESTFGTRTDITVTLEGGGALSLSGSGSLLFIGNGQTVIAKDLTLQGRKDNGASVVRIEKGGKFLMKGSALVTGNTASASYSYNYSPSGGGVWVGYGGTFTMEGGVISGNTASSRSSPSGGGVFVSEGGTFTMKGGDISSNTTKSNPSGGGVYNSGTFIMEGGTISGNTTSSSSSYSYSSSFSGGGLYTDKDGRFTKTGGIIYGNDGEQNLRNIAGSKNGHAVYNGQNGNWRNSTADPAMNPNSYGFWLNETE